MKYLKSFESKINRKYWLLPTDERFKKSLKQIKCPSHFIDYLTNDLNYIYINNNIHFIFISLDKYNNFRDRAPNEQDCLDIYKQHGYKFMGNINIKDYEIEAKKYNL